MISFSEAQHLVIEQARSFGKEKVNLDEAVGRVLCETIIADRDYPPFNRAAMDGYAIRHADWIAGLRSFIIREIIYAGSSENTSIGKGECYKIMTGAAVPRCANAIIRKEDVTEKGNEIKCAIESLDVLQHIARQGEDLKNGEVVYSNPVVCTPPIIGMLASIGKSQPSVEMLPRVSIITTGNEIVNVDATVKAVQIRNSNSHVLKAFLKSWNIVPAYCTHVEDELDKIEIALQPALKTDIIIMCGGVSAGDADYIPTALDKLGASKIFHKVSIKPGKPIWFGKFQQQLIFALPGNPFSCMVTFKLFIELFLSKCFGLGTPVQLELPLQGLRSKKNSLDEFFPVRISGAPSGVQIIPFNGSGDITAAVNAHAIARHPAQLPDISEGSVITCYPLF
jgi:molybdopterin molybdotransferase